MNSNKRQKYLEEKYGFSNAELIMDQMIWAGMSKEMFLESWEEPEEKWISNNENESLEVWLSTGHHFYWRDNLLVKWLYADDDQ